MKWPRFDSDPELVKQVFRALDPDSGGDVTLSEWSAIELLWKELQLTTLEFLAHVNRIFGGDWEQAWEEMDRNGNGCLELSEWEDAARYVGFFGPMIPIFHLVADDVAGISIAISRVGWDTLKAFWNDREVVLKEVQVQTLSRGSRIMSRGMSRTGTLF